MQPVDRIRRPRHVDIPHPKPSQIRFVATGWQSAAGLLEGYAL